MNTGKYWYIGKCCIIFMIAFDDSVNPWGKDSTFSCSINVTVLHEAHS